MPVWPTEPRPRLALAVATGAIVLAAGGGAVAQLDQGDAPPASVGTKALKDGSVTGIKLADGAVTTRAIREGGVRSGRIASNAVTNRTLANNSVTSTKIAQGGVQRLDLAIAARVPIVVTRVVGTQIPVGVTDSLVARCAPGEVLISGGFGGLPNTVSPGGTQANVLASRPDPAAEGQPPAGWFVTFSNLSTNLASVTAYAVCAQPG
ncbi:MAG TPA: hypothetical protein PKD59_07070 [Miltoncostaeaceae bacterium]|nr:hypothetical protein [Miltoncostaeaceae bacterium]